MQDRFKFRVWLKDANKMYNVCSLHIGTNKAIISSRRGNVSIHINKNNILMQCTGLKDKNSKLIYEGDRVYINCEDETAIIKWSDDLARFTIHFEDEAVFADFDNYYSKELEVIGNIYENSELPKE